MSIPNDNTSTYSSMLIQAQAKGLRSFTKEAADCGQEELGMLVDEMIALVRRPNTGFCKTMPPSEAPRATQDAHRRASPEGRAASVNSPIDPGTRLAICFKEK